MNCPHCGKLLTQQEDWLAHSKACREVMAEARRGRSSQAREEKLCACGAVGTLEFNEDWCRAAKEFNVGVVTQDKRHD